MLLILLDHSVSSYLQVIDVFFQQPSGSSTRTLTERSISYTQDTLAMGIVSTHAVQMTLPPPTHLTYDFDRLLALVALRSTVVSTRALGILTAIRSALGTRFEICIGTRPVLH